MPARELKPNLLGSRRAAMVKESLYELLKCEYVTLRCASVSNPSGLRDFTGLLHQKTASLSNVSTVFSYRRPWNRRSSSDWLCPANPNGKKSDFAKRSHRVRQEQEPKGGQVDRSGEGSVILSAASVAP